MIFDLKRSIDLIWLLISGAIFIVADLVFRRRADPGNATKHNVVEVQPYAQARRLHRKTVTPTVVVSILFYFHSIAKEELMGGRLGMCPLHVWNRGLWHLIILTHFSNMIKWVPLFTFLPISSNKICEAPDVTDCYRANKTDCYRANKTCQYFFIILPKK